MLQKITQIARNRHIWSFCLSILPTSPNLILPGSVAFGIVTGRYDEVRVQPRPVPVDHEVGEDEGVQGLLAEPVVVALSANSLVNMTTF